MDRGAAASGMLKAGLALFSLVRMALGIGRLAPPPLLILRPPGGAIAYAGFQ